MTSLDSLITEIARHSCIVHARCTVIYTGRASSTLQLGDYLVIKKPDDSVQIHTAKLIKPINYQPKAVSYTADGNTLICSSKTETLKITFTHVHDFCPISSWDHNELVMKGTERQLVEAICTDISNICGDEILNVETEYQTPLGPIDVVATGKNYIHVLEVKRKTANIAAFSQLLRYHSYMRDQFPNVQGWLLAPHASASCLDNCAAHSLKYHQITTS